MSRLVHRVRGRPSGAARLRLGRRSVAPRRRRTRGLRSLVRGVLIRAADRRTDPGAQVRRAACDRAGARPAACTRGGGLRAASRCRLRSARAAASPPLRGARVQPIGRDRVLRGARTAAPLRAQTRGPMPRDATAGRSAPGRSAHQRARRLRSCARTGAWTPHRHRRRRHHHGQHRCRAGARAAAGGRRLDRSVVRGVRDARLPQLTTPVGCEDFSGTAGRPVACPGAFVDSPRADTQAVRDAHPKDLLSFLPRKLRHRGRHRGRARRRRTRRRRRIRSLAATPA